MTPTPETLRRYGRPGAPIPGSDYVRAYCVRCAEPIRVSPRSKASVHQCDDCHDPARTARDRAGDQRARLAFQYGT